jgi:hypothetical protein
MNNSNVETSVVAPSVQAKDPDLTKQIILGQEKEFRFEVEFGTKLTIKVHCFYCFCFLCI